MSDQPLDRDRITKLVSTIFAEDLHAKRVASLAGAAVGVLEGAALGIHAIGNALAMAEGLKGKHAVKQVDRLLSNKGICVWDLFANWVPHIVGDRPEVVTALDWTDFDADDQSTIVLSMITSHGRATPLLWKTVMKSELSGWRNEHEDALLERFREVLPAGVKVTVLADRGFGDQALYELLKDQLGLDFVVRFSGIVKVTSADGETKPAKDWVPKTGRPLRLRGARVTKVGRELGAVVCVKANGPWSPTEPRSRSSYWPGRRRFVTTVFPESGSDTVFSPTSPYGRWKVRQRSSPPAGPPPEARVVDDVRRVAPLGSVPHPPDADVTLPLLGNSSPRPVVT